MENKAFRFELKELDEQGVFKGYAAVFGNKDLGGDIIAPGAFTKTLKDKGGRVVLLDGHDANRRIGVAYLEEDAKGLRVSKGVLNLVKQAAQDAYADLKFGLEHGVPMEMSIGFDTVNRDIVDNVRHLKEIKLWEVSIVTFAMNPKAKVTAVKESDDTIASLTARIDALEALIEEQKASAAPPADPGAAPESAAAQPAVPPSEHTAELAAVLSDLRDRLRTINGG